MDGIVVVKEAPLSDRARAATAQARRLMPQWAAFAKMLARKPGLAVKLTGGTPCTDGSTVWLRPPIELGDEVPHDKSLCSQRDTETKKMLCPACAVLDSVNTTIFHEIAHIVHGSFEQVSDADRLRLVDDAIRLEYADDAGRAAKILSRVKSHGGLITNWMAAANLVSPYLPMLLNAIEDVWVNAEMMEARPGTRTMFSAQTTDIFENGIEQADGEVIKWSDQPLNAQVVIGVYCKGSGLDYSSWLAPKVVEDLNDYEVQSLCHRIKTSRTAKNRYRLSIQILEALRRLGYLVSDEDPDDEPDPGEGEPDGDAKSEPGETDGDAYGKGAGGDADSEGGASGGDDSAPDTESGTDDGLDGGHEDSDPDKGEDDGDPGAEGSDSADESDDGKGGEGEGGGSATDASKGEPAGGGPDGEHVTSDEVPMGAPDEVEDLFKIFGRHDEEDGPSTPEERRIEQEVDRAILQGEHFDQPSRLGGLSVYRGDDAEEHQAFRRGLSVDPVPETILAPSLANLRLAFAENHKGKQERNLTRGRRLDSKVLGRRIATDDPRIFSRKSLPGKRDYFVVIGLDISGSTAWGIINLIKQAGMAQAELLSRLRIPFAVYCHSGDGDGVAIFEIKAPNEPWNDKSRRALDRIGSYFANLDGHTLEFYRKRCLEHRATDKLIMYYTDGAMPAENYAEELEVLTRNIDLCKKQGVRLIGIGAQTDDPLKYGLDMIRLDTIEDLPKVVQGLRERLA